MDFPWEISARIRGVYTESRAGRTRSVKGRNGEAKILAGNFPGKEPDQMKKRTPLDQRRTNKYNAKRACWLAIRH
jgi:hypothetical protein